MNKRVLLLKIESALDDFYKVVGQEKIKNVHLMRTVGFILNTIEGLNQYKKYSFDVFRTRNLIGTIIDAVKDSIGSSSSELTEEQLKKLTELSFEINQAAYDYMQLVDNEILGRVQSTPDEAD
ncbi:MAG: hypothetical protein A4S09_04880 [Proteobacteria bacterium SG_bin7]|nr:MAG: hypothetical protein A4S09_04880 [Proteobacteria bacterium SG_bin7]